MMFFFSFTQLLGRNVYPVSMLSYIPESPLPHPRVRAIRKVTDDLVAESSESQEESDPAPKHRKSKVQLNLDYPD